MAKKTEMTVKRPRSGGRLGMAVLAAMIASLPSPAFAVETGAASPEALFERFNGAVSAKDMGEIVACATPTDRAVLALSLVMASGMAVAMQTMGEGMAGEDGKAKGLEQELEGILERYGLKKRMDALENEPAPEPGGLSPEQQKQRIGELFAGLDTVGLVVALDGFLNGFGSGGSKKKAEFHELENLVVSGDSATATMNGQTTPFVRIDGRWYVAMPEAPAAKAKKEPEPPAGLPERITEDGKAVGEMTVNGRTTKFAHATARKRKVEFTDGTSETRVQIRLSDAPVPDDVGERMKAVREGRLRYIELEIEDGQTEPTFLDIADKDLPSHTEPLFLGTAFLTEDTGPETRAGRVFTSGKRESGENTFEFAVTFRARIEQGGE